MSDLSLIKILKTPKYLLTALGVAFILFDLQFYIMATLPEVKDNMCMLGAALTLLNIIFSIVLSILIGILIVGFIALVLQKSGKQKIAISGFAGLGLASGTLTVFCTLCTLPVITLFGSSLWLAFFTDYNLLAKIISLVMLLLALYLLNRQLKYECKKCVVK